MSLLAIIITIAIIGLLLWAINALIPMEPMIKRILNIVVVVFLVIWLLKIVGAFSFLGNVRV